jgi:hypothetical protein
MARFLNYNCQICGHGNRHLQSNCNIDLNTLIDLTFGEDQAVANRIGFMLMSETPDINELFAESEIGRNDRIAARARGINDPLRFTPNQQQQSSNRRSDGRRNDRDEPDGRFRMEYDSNISRPKSKGAVHKKHNRRRSPSSSSSDSTSSSSSSSSSEDSSDESTGKYSKHRKNRKHRSHKGRKHSKKDKHSRKSREEKEDKKERQLKEEKQKVIRHMQKKKLQYTFTKPVDYSDGDEYQSDYSRASSTRSTSKLVKNVAINRSNGIIGSSDYGI